MAPIYTFDAGGNPTAQAGPGQVDVTQGGASSLGSLAPHPTVSNDPYSIFNSRLADMLTQATKQASTNRTTLGGAKDALTTESVSPAGVTPFNPAVFSQDQVAGAQSLRAGFQPAITSISTQEENTAAATQGIKDTIGALQTATQPLILQPGQSLVARDGSVLKNGHSYTPQMNPLTGLVDGFDQNTGTWASEDTSTMPMAPSSTGGNFGSSSNSLVGGIDFSGASTSTKPYATDPNYSSEVDSLYNQIKNSAPIPTAQTIDTFIKSQVGGKSPVTGQMVITAATQYGVDPNVLAAVLGHESDFGTSGAATGTMNAGNVGNTGTSTQNYKSWQAGVNAAAYEIARRMPGNQNAKQATDAPSSTPVPPATSPVGGTFSQEATQKLQQLPKAMQQYADAGPLGVAYINADRVPDALKQSIQTLSARAGIPFVTAADVSGVKSIETVLSNLSSMQTLANKTLASGVMGHLQDLTLGPMAQFFQTEWGQNLGLFDNYRDTAIKAVQALAGGAGSGLRINGAEIAANTQNLPQATDSVENATKQILQLKQMIYTNLANTYPYAMAPVKNANGQTGNIPIGNLANALKAGYTLQ